jgi:hypothetical protein
MIGTSPGKRKVCKYLIAMPKNPASFNNMGESDGPHGLTCSGKRYYSTGQTLFLIPRYRNSVTCCTASCPSIQPFTWYLRCGPCFTEYLSLCFLYRCPYIYMTELWIQPLRHYSIYVLYSNYV